jgi:zinc/manganese transport system substrate-binding protein
MIDSEFVTPKLNRSPAHSWTAESRGLRTSPTRKMKVRMIIDTLRAAMRRAALLAAAPAAVVFAAGLGACGIAARPGDPIRVVAAESFYGSILAQVGGRHVHVTSIIKDAAADPHEYQSNVGDAEAVAQARLVVINGAGYDSFVDKLAGASPASDRVLLHVDKLVGVHGSDPNPHFWYDPATAAAVARAAARVLASADPAHAAAYRAGAARVVASLAPVDAEIASLRGKYAGAPFAYTERVPAYLTAKLGLGLKTPPDFARADEQGTDPPPRSVAAMRALITGHRVKLLLYNSQASSSSAASVRDLARSSGVPVVAVSETSPPGATYQRWLLAEVRAIGRALSQ